MSSPTTPANQAPPMKFEGVNHLALVSSDMARTVDFYQGILGMPLVKTLELPNGQGQHFFFDCGGGNHLAFFWFPDASPASPGIASAGGLPGSGELTSAHGSMNHVALSVAERDLEEYRERLIAAGVEAMPVINHDDSEFGISRNVHEGVFVRSVYFLDPDGILLELAAWTRQFTADDVQHAPVDGAGN